MTHTATSDPKRNLSKMNDGVATLAATLGLSNDGSVPPYDPHEDCQPWMTHAEFEEQDAAACERLAKEGRSRTSHREHAQLDVAAARARYIQQHGSDEGFVPSREIPCPGTLLIPDDEINGASPVLSSFCDVCGFQMGLRRAQFDPQYKLKDRLKRSGLPTIFSGKRMDPVPEQEEARGVAREWMLSWDKPYDGGEGNPRGDAENPGPPLRLPAIALYGLPGRGKSHIICSIAETLVRKFNADVQYWPLAALLNKVREGFNDAASQEMKWAAQMAWKRAMEVECLVLDDIGAERPTEWAQEQFQILVDHRYQQELPILLASNIPPGQWDDQFGPRAASRLRGMTFQFEIKGDDLRSR